MRLKKTYYRYSDDLYRIFRAEYVDALISELNNAYVALTRVSHEMYICLPGKAGQGFNLGLRDVAELAQVMSFAVRQKQDLGNRLYLDYFWQNRLPDIERTLARTDALALLFANNNLLLKLARNFALKWLDIIPPVKKMFARQAMGLFDDLPALARGVRLNDHPNPIPVELIEFGLAEPNKPAAKGAA